MSHHHTYTQTNMLQAWEYLPDQAAVSTHQPTEHLYHPEEHIYRPREHVLHSEKLTNSDRYAGSREGQTEGQTEAQSEGQRETHRQTETEERQRCRTSAAFMQDVFALQRALQRVLSPA